MDRGNGEGEPRATLETIELELTTYKIRLRFQDHEEPLVLHFDTPSRRFYFALIALILTEMKNLGRPGFIHIRKHEEILKLLDHSLAGPHASETVDGMWEKIRKAWQYRLPDLEEAVHFKILDRDRIRPYEKGGKYRYECSEEESDTWANLFVYDENNPWRFKFAVDSVSLDLEDISLTFGDLRDDAAWQGFVRGLSEAEELVQEGFVEVRERAKSKWWYKAALAAMAILIIAAAGAAIWNLSFRPAPPPAVLEVPDKPSIAVLPFVNMSGDPEQEYFSDGITEDIITNLAKVSGLFVISESSSFLYKGKKAKIREIAKELGVRYMLEGSIRRAGDNLRITAQLIDGKTGHHVWADTYDRKIKDIFVVQDDVTQKVVSELAVTLKASEWDRLSRKHTENFEAYELYLRARNMCRFMKKEDHLKTLKLCQRIIEIDPSFAGGYQQSSFILARMVRLGYSTSPHQDLERALELAQKAVSVDDTFGPGHLALASAYLNKGQHDDALAAAITAVRIEPGGFDAHFWLGFYLHWAGRGEEAVKAIKEAQQLNPKYLSSGGPANLCFLGYAFFTAGEYEESIAAWKKAIELFGPFVNRQAFLTASYSELGRDAEARSMARQLLKNNPKFSLTSWQFARLYKNPEDTEHLLNALRKAGLPE
jgi:TolB-like protein/Tfp pilus assembly protein PilF